jgi:hypothetical protein
LNSPLCVNSRIGEIVEQEVIPGHYVVVMAQGTALIASVR